MKYKPATSRTLRPIALLAILIPIIFICSAGDASTAIGDQVELKATHQAGVPFHQEPRGTNTFQRIWPKPNKPVTKGNKRSVDAKT